MWPFKKKVVEPPLFVVLGGKRVYYDPDPLDPSSKPIDLNPKPRNPPQAEGEN